MIPHLHTLCKLIKRFFFKLYAIYLHSCQNRCTSTYLPVAVACTTCWQHLRTCSSLFPQRRSPDDSVGSCPGKWQSKQDRGLFKKSQMECPNNWYWSVIVNSNKMIDLQPSCTTCHKGYDLRSGQAIFEKMTD